MGRAQREGRWCAVGIADLAMHHEWHPLMAVSSRDAGCADPGHITDGPST